jgi:pyruvate,water dikinase
LALLRGLGNTNADIYVDMQELAHIARRNPPLLRLLRETPPGDIMRLAEQPQASEFMRHVERFLQRWGDRVIGPIDFMHASWREDPSSLISTIAIFAANDTSRSSADAEEQAEERHQVERTVVERLSDDGYQRADFIALLRRAQTWPPFLENHNYLIEQTLASQIRRLALSIGQRLSATGLIDEPGDIFFLSRKEISFLASGHQGFDARSVVRANRETYTNRLGVNIPQTLGASMAAGAKKDGDSAEGAPGNLLLAQFHPDPTAELPLRLRGIPAAPGRAAGPARIIDDLDDFATVLPGDILVCQRTSPPWTMLFPIIAGLVTNAGSGMLQHSAINAREFGIPAVIGTRVATEVIRPGQQIVVDGARGVVELLA